MPYSYKRRKKVIIIIILTLIILSLTFTFSIINFYKNDSDSNKQANYGKKINNQIKLVPHQSNETAEIIDSLSYIVNYMDYGMVKGPVDSDRLKESIEQCKEEVIKLKESIEEDAEYAEYVDDSKQSKKRVQEYKSGALKAVDDFSGKLNELSEKVNSDLADDNEIKDGINVVKNTLNSMIIKEEPKIKNNGYSHSLVEKSKDKNAEKGKMAESKYDSASAKMNSEYTSYLDLNDEMKALADSFSTPAEIYEYVRNNYQYIQYTGLRLGAAGTFEQKAGNDFDQAALLIALLRYKGYKAKFVVGIVSKTGVEHAWVKLLSEKEVELDPSFKKYEKDNNSKSKDNDEIKKYLDAESENLERFYSLAYLFDTYEIEIEDEYEHSSLLDETYFQDDESFSKFLTDVSGIEKKSDIGTDEIRNTLGIRRIKKEVDGNLPDSLPYEVNTRLYEEDYLSDNFIDKINLSIQYEESKESKSFYTPELYGHRISVLYEPSTDKYKQIVRSYQNLYFTPSYLIRVRPVLMIDGKKIIEGKEQIPGTYTDFCVEINEAAIDSVRIESSLMAGGIYGIVFDYNDINSEMLKDNLGLLKECESDIHSGKSDFTEAVSILENVIGEAYFSSLNYNNCILAATNGVACERGISECIVGYIPNSCSIAGVPIATNEGRLYIDVASDRTAVATLDENKNISDTDIKKFMMMSGFVSSYLEGNIIEKTVNCKCASAISLINEARKRGITIYTISSKNESDLNLLSINEVDKKIIKEEIGKGNIVIIPEKEMYFYEWYGVPYIVMNPVTGEASYMTGMGVCGGYLAEISKVTTKVASVKALVKEIDSLILAVVNEREVRENLLSDISAESGEADYSELFKKLKAYSVCSNLFDSIQKKNDEYKIGNGDAYGTQAQESVILDILTILNDI
ncbi:MAG: transglutaminase-like domain-containing protein [Lachnospiraceae bacterium]|nr:transglutaminase-like domain-containing protein [Lachnospiraceae bacterium]